PDPRRQAVREAPHHLAHRQGDEGRSREEHRVRRVRLHHEAGRDRPASLADAGVAVPVERAPSPAEAQLDLERIELQLLLEGAYRHCGYDFREYALASLRRRVWRRVREENLASITSLTERVLHDQACMARLLADLSIYVTAMFRDPQFYVAFAEHVVPRLHTYPFTRIWVAGCSTGEEVYSLSILLTEHELYDRTRIYATDINQRVLERAR